MTADRDSPQPPQRSPCQQRFSPITIDVDLKPSKSQDQNPAKPEAISYTAQMSSKRFNPPNRFDNIEIEWEIPPPTQKLVIIQDATRSALVRNEAPDIPYSWGLNPYRGCLHACKYCFAREYHQYLGYSAGTDFERRIVVKPDLARILETELNRPSWRGEPVVLSNATDPYQRLEAQMEITRDCLEVLARYRNPTVLITRSPLITRDILLLSELAAHDAVRVNISIPIGDPELCRLIEPGAPGPNARLRAVQALAEAGIPVGVSLAPVIPGLTDHLIPETLRRAREAGATWAWWGLLRLSRSVAPIFERHLREVLPDRADAVMRRLADARGGALNGPPGRRMKGSGAAWTATNQLARLSRRRLGFTEPPTFPELSPFQRPEDGMQMAMF